MPYDLSSPVGYDAYAYHGRSLIQDFIRENVNFTMDVPQANGVQPSDAYPIGILGAGSGGLYTAMILDFLDIPYKILEAQDHVGGRLFTYHFPNTQGGPYNYFDVGAMRIPNILAMKRINHLVDDPSLGLKLVPFIFTANNTLLSYNGITINRNDKVASDSDIFRASDVIQDTSDKQKYISVGVKAIVDDVIGPYAEGLLNDLKTGSTTGWEAMKAVDEYSTRAYMSTKYRPSRALGLPDAPLPNDVVNWLETFDKSTGWYDRAFSETVLEAITFGWQPPNSTAPPTQWRTVDGGLNKVAQAMYAYLQKKQPEPVTFNSRVDYIGLANVNKSNVVEVKTDNQTYQFSHVITTIPLPVMRTMDIRKAGLSLVQSNAIRELNYGPSMKIGVQFKSAWWTLGTDRNGKPLNIIGGQTYTDSLLRTVVYPSYGDVQHGNTSVIIASYSWTEDAERLSALIDKDNDLLRRLVLQDLAEIHNVDLGKLTDEYIDIFPWSWSRDPYTMGAFAFFGPGKYRNTYTSLNSPAAGGLLHFAGEAISVRHAWIEGALDSAWRAVSGILMLPEFEGKRAKFTERWGVNEEWIQRGSGTNSSMGDKLFSPTETHLLGFPSLSLSHQGNLQPHAQ